MPLPFILWGAAAALAATGVVKGVEASNNFGRAKEIGEDAERLYRKYSRLLDDERAQTQKTLEELGTLKVHVFSHQIKYMVDAIKRSKSSGSKLEGFNEDLSVDKIKEYEKLVLNSLEFEKGLAAGAAGGALAAMGAYGAVGTLATASTGAAITGLSGAAATNATLAWLGGGALSAGGFGMAGGMLALGGIVLGPALAIGGFMMAGKAEEALTQARAYDAQVDEAVAKIKTIILALTAVRTNAAEITGVINNLVERFEKIKVSDDSHQAAFDNMLVLGISLKKVLDIPIIKPDGMAVENIKATYSGFIRL